MPCVRHNKIKQKTISSRQSGNCGHTYVAPEKINKLVINCLMIDDKRTPACACVSFTENNKMKLNKIPKITVILQMHGHVTPTVWD